MLVFYYKFFPSLNSSLGSQPSFNCLDPSDKVWHSLSAIITRAMETNKQCDSLESLRKLINNAVDVVHEHMISNNDPPLDIASSKRHPLRDRYGQDVARALKCLSSAGIMLRALCDPEAWLHDIMFNVRDFLKPGIYYHRTSNIPPSVS